MANRTTVDNVKLIIATQLQNANIEAYITSANALVTDALGSSSLNETTLEQIEMWLTAHMIASTQERMAKSEEAGGAKIVYTGNYGMGLESTTYGQMVKTLDTTGKMATLGDKKIVFKAISQF